MSDSLDALLKEIDKEHKHPERFEEFGKRFLALTKDDVPWTTKEKCKFTLGYFMDLAATSIKKEDRKALEKLVPILRRLIQNGSIAKEALSSKSLSTVADSGISSLDLPDVVYRSLSLLNYLLNMPDSFENREKLIKKAEKLGKELLPRIFKVIDGYSDSLCKQVTSEDKETIMKRRSIDASIKILTYFTKFPQCMESIDFQSYKSIIEFMDVDKVYSILAPLDFLLTPTICNYISSVFPFINSNYIFKLQKLMYEDNASVFLQLIQYAIERNKEESKKLRKEMARRAISLILNDERGYELLKKMFPIPLLEFLEVGIGYKVPGGTDVKRVTLTKKELNSYSPNIKEWNKEAFAALGECYRINQTNELFFELFWNKIDNEYNSPRFKWSGKNLDEICGIISAELKYASVAGRKISLRDVPFQSIRSNRPDDIAQKSDEKHSLSTTTDKNLHIMDYRILQLFMELKYFDAMFKEGGAGIQDPRGYDLPVPSDNRRRVICKEIYDDDWTSESASRNELYLPNVGEVVVPILSNIYTQVGSFDNKDFKNSAEPIVDEYLGLINLLAVHKPVSIVSDYLFHFVSLILQKCNKQMRNEEVEKEGLFKVVLGLVNTLKKLASCNNVRAKICGGILKYGIHNGLIDFIRYFVKTEPRLTLVSPSTGLEGTGYETSLESISNVFDLFSIILTTMHRDSYPLIMPEIYVMFCKYVIKIFVTKFKEFNQNKEPKDQCIDSTTMKFINSFLRFLRTLNTYTLCARYHFTSGILELSILILLLQNTYVHKWDAHKLSSSKLLKNNTSARVTDNEVKSGPSSARSSAVLSKDGSTTDSGSGKKSTRESVRISENRKSKAMTEVEVKEKERQSTRTKEVPSVSTPKQEDNSIYLDIYKRETIIFLAEVHEVQEILEENRRAKVENEGKQSYLSHYLPTSVVTKLEDIYKKMRVSRGSLDDEDLAGLLALVHRDVLSPQLIYSNMYRCNTIRCIINAFELWLEYKNTETNKPEDISFLAFIRQRQQHENNVFKGKHSFSFVTLQDNLVISKVSYPLIEVTWDDKEAINTSGRNRYVTVEGTRYNEIGGVYIELFLLQPDAKLVGIKTFYAGMIRWILANRKDVETEYGPSSEISDLMILYRDVIKSFYLLLKSHKDIFDPQNDLAKLGDFFIAFNGNTNNARVAEIYMKTLEATQLVLIEATQKECDKKVVHELLDKYISILKNTAVSGLIGSISTSSSSRQPQKFQHKKIFENFNNWFSIIESGSYNVLEFVHWLRSKNNVLESSKSDLINMLGLALRTACVESTKKTTGKLLAKDKGLVYVTEGFFVKEEKKESTKIEKEEVGEKNAFNVSEIPIYAATIVLNLAKVFGLNGDVQENEYDIGETIQECVESDTIDNDDVEDDNKENKKSRKDSRKSKNKSKKENYEIVEKKENVKRTGSKASVLPSVLLRDIFPLAILRDAGDNKRLTEYISGSRRLLSPFSIWDETMTEELKEFIEKYLKCCDSTDPSAEHLSSLTYSIFSREPVINGVVVRGFVSLAVSPDGRLPQSILDAVNDDFVEQCLIAVSKEIAGGKFRSNGGEEADRTLYSALIKSLDSTQNSEFQISKGPEFDILLRLALGGREKEKSDELTTRRNRYLPLTIAHIYKLFQYLLQGDISIKTASSFTQSSIVALCAKTTVCMHVWLGSCDSNDEEDNVMEPVYWRFTRCYPLLYLLLSKYDFIKQYLHARGLYLTVYSFLSLIGRMMDIDKANSESNKDSELESLRTIFILHVAHISHILSLSPKRKKILKSLESIVSPFFVDIINNIKIPTPESYDLSLLAIKLTNGVKSAENYDDNAFEEAVRILIPMMGKEEVFTPTYYFSHSIVNENLKFLKSELGASCKETEKIFYCDRDAFSSAVSGSKPPAREKFSASSISIDKWEVKLISYRSLIYDREICVGGVFLRAFLRQPHCKEVDSKALVDNLSREVFVLAKDKKKCDVENAEKESALSLMLGCLEKILEFHTNFVGRSSLLDLAAALLRILSYPSLERLRRCKQNKSVKEKGENGPKNPIVGTSINLISKILSTPETLSIFKKVDNTHNLMAILLDPIRPEKDRETIVTLAKYIGINGKTVDVLEPVVKGGLPIGLISLMFSDDETLPNLACGALSSLVFNYSKCSSSLEACLPTSIYEKLDHDATEILEEVAKMTEETKIAWRDASFDESYRVLNGEIDSSTPFHWQPERVKEQVDKALALLARKEEEANNAANEVEQVNETVDNNSDAPAKEEEEKEEE